MENPRAMILGFGGKQDHRPWKRAFDAWVKNTDEGNKKPARG
ncbi:hypothetical protein [Geoalkalibacter halelectricus]|nr:hypothetical protein [Geoalkalibacter halelectricus]